MKHRKEKDKSSVDPEILTPPLSFANNSFSISSSTENLLADENDNYVSPHVPSHMLEAMEEAYDEVVECSHRAISEVKEVSHKVMEEAQKAMEKLYYTFHELPDHMKDNDFILSGYRAYYSAKQCLFSIFCIHKKE